MLIRAGRIQTFNLLTIIVDEFLDLSFCNLRDAASNFEIVQTTRIDAALFSFDLKQYGVDLLVQNSGASLCDLVVELLEFFTHSRLEIG